MATAKLRKVRGTEADKNFVMLFMDEKPYELMTTGEEIKIMFDSIQEDFPGISLGRVFVVEYKYPQIAIWFNALLWNIPADYVEGPLPLLNGSGSR